MVWSINAFLPRIHKRYYFVLFLPMIAMFAIITSFGAELQLFTMNQIIPLSPDSAMNDYLNSPLLFPNLEKWLLNAISMRFILDGLILYAVVMYSQSMRLSFIYISTAGFCVLMATDIFDAYTNSSIKIDDMLVNLFSNIFGGIIIAFVGNIVLLILETGRSYFGSHKLSQDIFCIILPIFVGLLISISCYTAFYDIFGTSPAKIDVAFNQPATGIYLTNKETDRSDPSQSFFPLPSSTSARLSVMVAEGETLLRLKNVTTNQYDLHVRLYANCDDDEMKGGNDYLVFRNIKSFAAAFSNGNSTLKTSKMSIGGLSSHKSGSGFYSESPLGGKNGYGIFQKEGSDFSWIANDGDTIRINAFMENAKGSRVVSAPRKLALGIDGKTHIIEFPGYGQTIPHVKRACHALTERSIRSNVVLDKTMLSGASFRLSERESDNVDINHPEWNIKSSPSWIRLDGIAEKPDFQTLGKLYYISFQGVISYLNLSGQDFNLKPYSQFQVKGKLNSYLLKDGRIRVTGTAEDAWIDDQYIIKTKWSLLPTEFKILIISMGSAIFVWLLKLLFERRYVLFNDSTAFWRS